jgi:Nucleotidyltransferase of unknown function (DUF6036)
MYKANSDGQLSKHVLLQALNHLGDLLAKRNQRLELVCCGGVVSVLYHHSRQTTHDVDVLFPNNPNVVNILRTLIDQVGQKFQLDHDEHDKWFNDSVSFIGLETKSDTVVFRHPYLVLKAADWHEMLAHKLTAFRGQRDITDAIHFLKEIKSADKQQVFVLVVKYRPFVPTIADTVFEKRFNQIWAEVHGK